MPSPRLGPFELLHRIGRGGMSDVWLGVHNADDVQVAIKVLTAERAREPHNVRMFRTEIRAVARLDHPHVVGVFDAGIVDTRAAAHSHGQLHTGMPYLVMDLLSGGSLWDYRGRLPWRHLKGLLLRLLDALAHAHARGVVHRDLKLTNVLLTHPERRAVITDFGLAQLRRDDAAVHLPAGTPNYMAPEQFADAWRDFGPWTDLYGFGCLAWTLATGTPPFHHEDWSETKRGHMEEVLPPFTPSLPVPEGFLTWLERMLEKDIGRRYQRAADAAWSLEQVEDDLPDGNDGLAAPLPDRPSEASTLTFGHTGDLWMNPAEAVGSGRLDAPPPPPTDWRGLPSRTRLHLRGAGLGLFHARPLPTVGRETERDLLWSSVVSLHAERAQARALVVEGAAGTGKTHLVRWLTQRAHELGAAHVWRCEHPPGGGHRSGIGGMLASHLHALGLDGAALDRRVAHSCRSWGTSDPKDHRMLADLIRPKHRRRSEQPISTRREALIAVRRHLRHVAARRPLILAIDDAHGGLDALLLARDLLLHSGPKPPRVLLVVVAGDQAAEGVASELLLGIAANAQRLRVDPLPDMDHLDMVRELLGLDGELARRVAERTLGHPGFAAALVADWVARDLLVTSPTGFRLKDGVDEVLPDDLFAFWQADLDRAIGGRAKPVRAALELAATLGMHVDTLRWRRITARAGLEASMDAVESLIAHRLVEARHPSSGWRFAHAMVREALLRSADEAGRRQELHRWVLEDLERQADIDPEEHARHLLGAGRVSEAVGRWVAAARRHGEQGHPHAVLDMLDRAERALVSDADLHARWVRELDVGRVRAFLMLGRLDEAESTALAAEDHFRDTPDHPDLAAVQTLLARVAFLRGDHAGAERIAREVIGRLRPADDLPPTDPERLADALRVAGLVEMGRDLARSERTLRDSIAWAKEAGAGPLWAETAGFLATALGYQDRHEEAAAVLQEALDSPHGASRALRGSLLNTQAELLRAAGETAQAERSYRESVTLLEQVGSLEAAVPRLNLAILAALDHRYDDAWSLAERCGHESTVQGRPPLMLAVRAVLVVAAIGLEHDEVAVDQAEQLLALDASGVRTEREIYDILHDAGSMLVQRGLTDVGMRVLTTADARVREPRVPV